MLVKRFAWAHVFAELYLSVQPTRRRRNKKFLFTLNYRLKIDVCQYVVSVAKVTRTQRQSQHKARNPHNQQQIIQKLSCRLLQCLIFRFDGSAGLSYTEQGCDRTTWAMFHGQNRVLLVPYVYSIDHSKTFRIFLDSARHSTKCMQ